MVKHALLSPGRTYRYYLSRSWNHKLPAIVFIGVNPSTADEEKDDQTIKKLITFSKNWGYGGFTILNLYPYITPHKENLPIYFKKEVFEKYQEKNMAFLKEHKETEIDVVFMWGKLHRKFYTDHVWRIKRWFPKALCFGKNQDGSPIHPLFLPYTTNLIPFSGKLKDKMNILSKLSDGKLRLKRKLPVINS